MNPKRKAILDRIKVFEEKIAKATEYLESGKHADWSGFRPLLTSKVRDGKPVPPHRDWVKNVFLPQTERALKRAEQLLDRIE